MRSSLELVVRKGSANQGFVDASLQAQAPTKPKPILAKTFDLILAKSKVWF